MIFWRNLALYNLLNSKEKKEAFEKNFGAINDNEMVDQGEESLCDCDEKLDEKFNDEIDDNVKGSNI